MFLNYRKIHQSNSKYCLKWSLFLFGPFVHGYRNLFCSYKHGQEKGRWLLKCRRKQSAQRKPIRSHIWIDIQPHPWHALYGIIVVGSRWIDHYTMLWIFKINLGCNAPPLCSVIKYSYKFKFLNPQNYQLLRPMPPMALYLNMRKKASSRHL